MIVAQQQFIVTQRCNATKLSLLSPNASNIAQMRAIEHVGWPERAPAAAVNSAISGMRAYYISLHNPWVCARRVVGEIIALVGQPVARPAGQRMKSVALSATPPSKKIWKSTDRLPVVLNCTTVSISFVVMQISPRPVKAPSLG